MKRLKIIAAILLVVGSSVVCQAQIKVVERSARKAPVWVDKAEPEFIVTSAIAATVDEAQNKCLDNIRSRVIESVAQNIRFETQSRVNQTTGTAGNHYSDQFSSSLKTQAANLPFVRGISVSKVADSYWEKREDKKSGVVSYLYAVRYPFPPVELKKLILEFDKQDKKMLAQLEELEAGLTSVTEIGQVDRAIAACKPLMTYFFDDVRRARTASVEESYRKLYKNIVIQTIDQKPGQTTLAFTFNGYPMTVVQPPVVKANCAEQVECIPEGDRMIVKYSTANCDNDIVSKLTLNFRIADRGLVHTIYFTPLDQSVSIEPVGVMLLSIGADSLSVDMDIRVARCEKLTIENFKIEIPVIDGIVVIDNIDQTLNGAGVHRLKFNYTGELKQVSSRLLSVARGALTFVCDKTGERVSFPLILPYKLK